MKKFAFSFAILIFASAFALSAPVRHFRVDKAQFAQAHVKSPRSAEITVDYEKKWLTLQVAQNMPACPEGQVCAQVMPETFRVELPIVSVRKDDCGISYVTAEEDARRNNGALKRLEIEDRSENSCPSQSTSDARAVYETRNFSRENGLEVSDVSTMTIRPWVGSFRGETLLMVKGSFLKGFPSYQTPKAGSLIVGQNTVEMTIQVTMNCKGQVCPRILPHPLHMELPIVNSEKIECGRLITARRDRLQSEGTYEEIQIRDLSRADCSSSRTTQKEVHYRSQYQGSSGNFEYEAAFTFAR